MALQSAYCFDVTRSTSVEIDQERLPWLLDQIEIELDRGEVYSQAITGLQKLIGGSTQSAQIILKEVGREAIQLTFQQLAIQSQMSPGNNQLETGKKVSESTKTPEAASNYPNHPPLSHLTNKPASFSTPPKKFTKAELAEQMASQNRDDRLRQIGQKLQQARQVRLLSQEQLHQQTLIPIHQIQSLETGCIERLPEDIYVRGFIRQLGNALGLDGIALAGSLPAPDPLKTVVPSWYRPEIESTLYLSPVHLYLGYAAFMTVAVGGLVYVSQQSNPGIKPNVAEAFPAAARHSVERQNLTSIPGLKFSHRGTNSWSRSEHIAGTDIAPPENMN